MQGLVRITRDKAQLLLLALQDEPWYRLGGNLVPGVIGQAAHSHKVKATSARLRRFLVSHRIARLLAGVDIADQGRSGHLRMPGCKASRRRTTHGMATNIGL